MKNPWGKKNPFLSMWLSGANAVAGAVRSRAVADLKRQASMTATKSARQISQAWTSPDTGKPAVRKQRKKNAK